MRRVTKLFGSLVVLWAGVAAADPWRVYGALQTGLVVDHVSGVRALGGALQAYVAVEAPMGLSLGVVAEGAETWGARLLGQQPLELDYRSLGGEVRLRFLQGMPVNPWMGMRLSYSSSTPLYFDDVGQVRRMLTQGLSAAMRVGVDVWLGDHLGFTVNTAWQWCDVRVESLAETAGACTQPLHSVLGGPTVRF
jgi:hypothetical protein